MNIERLIKMANEISAFFEAEPDREQAVQGVAGHIRRFWEPRMRRQIIEHYQRGAAGLAEVAREAIALLAAESSQSSN